MEEVMRFRFSTGLLALAASQTFSFAAAQGRDASIYPKK
jgi:hypothetical protein